MFRNLRSLLSYSQVPVRIAAQQDGHKLYRVRVVPQGKRMHAYLRSVLILGGFHVAASAMIQTFTSEWEEPLFIPLGFVEKEPRRRYQASDPDYQAFLKFSRDQTKLVAARAKILQTLVVLLEKSNGPKFGGNMKAEASMLYCHYPAGPPPDYKRKGLQISPASRDNSSLGGILLYPLRLFNLKYEWVSRPIPQNTMYRLSNTLYPSSVFYSFYGSVANTFNWLYNLQDNDYSVDSMGDLVAVGTTAIKQGLSDTQKALLIMRKLEPPPPGHAIIDGLVQVTGDDLVVSVDILVSFNPETLDDLRFHRAKVRFAGKNKGQGAVTGMEERPKDIIGTTMKAAVELQRQKKRFVKKEVKIEQQEQNVREKKPEDVKPLARILEEKQGTQISDPSPSKVVNKSGRGEERKADVDDATSSKS